MCELMLMIDLGPNRFPPSSPQPNKASILTFQALSSCTPATSTQMECDMNHFNSMAGPLSIATAVYESSHGLQSTIGQVSVL